MNYRFIKIHFINNIFTDLQNLFKFKLEFMKKLIFLFFFILIFIICLYLKVIENEERWLSYEEEETDV
jgi:hypothetical protein